MTPIYILLFCLLYLLIFIPFPYLAHKKKHYKIFFILASSSLIGYFVTVVDPPFPANGFNGLTWMKVMTIFVLPVYLIGVSSWIVLVIRKKKKSI